MLSVADESIETDQAGGPIHTIYRRRTPDSARAFAEAERYLPGGNSRQAGFWAPYPLTLTHGQDCFVWDVDGNRYIDLLNNYTALVHGHAHPRIVEAVQAQVPRGTCWAAINEAQTHLARQLVERVPSVEQDGERAGRYLIGRAMHSIVREFFRGGLLNPLRSMQVCQRATKQARNVPSMALSRSRR